MIPSGDKVIDSFFYFSIGIELCVGRSNFVFVELIIYGNVKNWAAQFVEANQLYLLYYICSKIKKKREDSRICVERRNQNQSRAVNLPVLMLHCIYCQSEFDMLSCIWVLIERQTDDKYFIITVLFPDSPFSQLY